MSEPVRPRRARPSPELIPPVSPPASTPTPPAPAPEVRVAPKRPFLLDLLPLETSRETRLSRFYERLAEGSLSTTRCPRDGSIHWPPRTACPQCHSEDLEWTDLPGHGTVYAFSAVLAGAPLGMEDAVPFAVGLVDLDGAPLRLFGRIEGKPWTGLHVGERVSVETYSVDDGRVFYRFRAGAPASPER